MHLKVTSTKLFLPAKHMNCCFGLDFVSRSMQHVQHVDPACLSAEVHCQLRGGPQRLYLTTFATGAGILIPHRVSENVRCQGCQLSLWHGIPIQRAARGMQTSGKSSDRIGSSIKCPYLWQEPEASLSTGQDRVKHWTRLLEHP